MRREGEGGRERVEKDGGRMEGERAGEREVEGG